MRSRHQRTPQLHISRKVVILVAHLMVDHHEALCVMGERKLPRHPYAAMQLNRLFSDPRTDASN
jgi:hypothetical protein